MLWGCQQPTVAPPPVDTETVALEDFYLPITDIETSQFDIGMSWLDVIEQLQHLKAHVDYTGEGDYFFLRTSEGKSMVIEAIQFIDEDGLLRIALKKIYLYDIQTLSDRKTFESIDNMMTLPEIVAVVGLPIQANYTHSVGGLYFPVSDGSVCYIQYFPNGSIRNYVGGFMEKDVLIYED